MKLLEAVRLLNPEFHTFRRLGGSTLSHSKPLSLNVKPSWDLESLATFRGSPQEAPEVVATGDLEAWRPAQ
jgi:hypothetical protein